MILPKTYVLPNSYIFILENEVMAFITMQNIRKPKIPSKLFAQKNQISPLVMINLTILVDFSSLFLTLRSSL